ncbi:hypothetical protein FA13DRAFT_1797448 [Coprinellus micaceus]|uniref:Fungal-type protein kinase domain-containing protein n=1 Tax=Coprinellus micaceus TaxID=71717 RepID=A0A4Y7SQV7_COPMI|nr:hypothetical protein FA13DRAFT_1797448 [Coprinellus micaceus]
MNRWVAFQELPSKRKDGEDMVFAPLKAIGDRIKQVNLGSQLEAAVGSTSKTLSDSNPNTGSDGPHDIPPVTASDSALHNPTAGWSYGIEPNRVIPVDGFFHRPIPELGSLSLSDVSVVCEYQTSTKVDDVIKLVAAACHIFDQDPLTIEDDNVSLWYFSRSHSAKSASFSLLENPRILVRVFITFLFAKQESAMLLRGRTNCCRVRASPKSSLQNEPTVTIDEQEWGVHVLTVGADLGVIDSNRPQTEAPRAYYAKQRYFLIYDEVCSDLDQDGVTSLQDVFVGLRGCLIALMLLFCAGWVHRDVSCGNVLPWRDPQGNLHGKLGDLEYAKKFPSASDSTALDPKIAMAIIKRQRREPDLGLLFGHRRGDEAEKKEEGRPPPSKPEQRQRDNVQHHFAHDLESLWWIAVWAITCRLGIWNNVETVFIPYLGVASVARMTFILGPGQLSRCLRVLPRSVSDPNSEAMEAARQWFAKSYTTWSEGPEKRRDAAEHSMDYVEIAELVLQKFSGDVPKLVKMDNPVYKAQLVADDEDAQTDTEHTSGKRSRPDG